MREIISVHIGQTGVGQPSSMFFETIKGKFFPRSVFVDLDPTVIDEVRMGRYHDLFGPNTLISGDMDAASNYARGYKDSLDVVFPAMDKIREHLEKCDSFHGMIFVNSYSGGTGSGLGSRLLHFVFRNLGYKQILTDFVVYPSPSVSSVIVEPYNSILAINERNSSWEKMECSFMFDNESLYDICCRNFDIERPTFKNLNQIISYVFSSLTASHRFDGALNAKLKDILMNLIPYSNIHYPVCSFAPMTSNTESISVDSMTRELFEPNSIMIKCDTKSSKYLACALLYRGNVFPRDVYSSITKIKEKKIFELVDYCPTGFKIGISSQLPASVPGSNFSMMQRSVCMFANTAAINEPFWRTYNKFNMLFSKRAFVHWYLNEGLEEMEFVEAKENIESIMMDSNRTVRPF